MKEGVFSLGESRSIAVRRFKALERSLKSKSQFEISQRLLTSTLRWNMLNWASHATKFITFRCMQLGRSHVRRAKFVLFSTPRPKLHQAYISLNKCLRRTMTPLISNNFPLIQLRSRPLLERLELFQTVLTHGWRLTLPAEPGGKYPIPDREISGRLARWSL